MKYNKVVIICLLVAVVLIACVLVAKAAGFVSFENGNTIVLWDNVRMIGPGLKMSVAGINDGEEVANGNIKIMDKDIYLGKYMAVGCSDYPVKTDCQAKIGDLGSQIFLQADVFKNDDLSVIVSNGGLELQGADVVFDDKVQLKGDTGFKNLLVNNNFTAEQAADLKDCAENPDFCDDPSVIADVLVVDRMHNNSDFSENINLPNLYLENGAIFYTNRLIDLDITEPEFTVAP